MERFLATVEPFRRLPPTELKRLVHVARETRYAKGETIFREGQRSDAVWLVKTGRVHLMKFLANGKASTTCVMTVGETFCCLPAMDRGPYPVDAVVAEESVIVRIPADDFHQAMSRSPSFTQETLCLFCERLRQVEHRSCMVYEPAEERLAKILLGLSKKLGPSIPLTRQELAEIAGTTLETAIRTLSRFSKRGWIRSARGTTTILKPDQLKTLISNP